MKAIAKKQLNKYFGILEEMNAKIEEIKETSENISEEMQNDFENKSEKWQESEKGETEQSKIDSLNNFVSYLDEVYSAIENAIIELGEVTGDN